MGCLQSKGCIGSMSSSPSQEHKVKGSLEGAKVGSIDRPASADGEGGGDGDQLHELGNDRLDVLINQFSSVSSQFLPSDGSKTVVVPLGNYELRYSFLSQRGFYPEALDKPNQDNFCIHTPLGTSLDDHFFGVFDGHGEFGTQCSQFVKQRLCENLLKHSQFNVDVIEAIRAAFLTTNSQLHSDILDDSMSGTTAITILVRGRTIYVANAGDSRAIIAEKRETDILAIDLSVDQTPFRSDELERVKRCGAKVLTLDQLEGLKDPDMQCWGKEEDDDGDPPRLWVQNGMYPGTAFTRSIGDSIAESIGVIASPEIYSLNLTPNHPFFVIASDGVFEFLSSQAVVDIVAKYDDPHDACAAVVAESYRLWLQYETRTDDITIIVVHVNGLNKITDVENAYDAPLKSLPQIMEATGSESPFANTLNSKTNRFRHGLSRTQLKAIENSLDSAHTWVPPYASYRKTWEEEAHIERVLRDHFLFRRLTDSQSHVLLDCMQRMEVKRGDLVVEQGREGECFYVVGNGEFEVLAAQEEGMEVVTKVLHRYTAENLSSFGELAFMYNKPLQASVRAVTPGTLWALRREDFRAILLSEFSNISSLKLLRSIEPFSRLTILQLSRISECLVEVSFSDGQKIIDKGESLSGLYIIRKGHVRLTLYIDTLSPGACCQFSCYLDQRTENQDSHEHVVELTDGNHFGEWTLIGESVTSLSAISVGDSLCSIITKEKFDSAVGSAPNHIKLQDSLASSRDNVLCSDAITCKTITSSDLDWKMSIYATDCTEIGNVHLKGTDTIGCLKRFSRRKIKELGKKAQVMKEKELLLSLGGSTGVPLVICTFADQFHVGILFNCCLACPLSTILSTSLDEYSAKFCAASLVVVLQELHKNSVLHRGICADAVMLDQTGHLQLVDFRFAKKLIGERTFTICGVADSLAPEILLGKGHGFAADWWALGLLTYFMLQAEMPFGLGAENVAEASEKITSGSLTLPQTFSCEAADFITKLLDANEITRLGSEGADSVKAHSWFNGINWVDVADGTLPVPREISSRVEAFLQSRALEVVEPASPTQVPGELSSPEWLEDW